MSEKVMTIPALVVERLVRGRVAADMLLVIGASALIAIAAQIAIPLPFTPVPLTLQPLAVIFIGAALGSTRGAAAAALYLLEGFSGLPVFAQGHGGPAWLLGATAGYLYSYPFAAWLAGFVSERGWGSTITRAITGMLLALGVIYLGGWSWLAALTDARYAFTAGVAPFVVADIVKVAIGAALLPKAQRMMSPSL
ncbi:MAG TPA: biotin transporter BioY [Thermoanaerobaculia bacterium]|nr:biotin transporter BioY [Thermoanaerobaculia bacterium]